MTAAVIYEVIPPDPEATAEVDYHALKSLKNGVQHTLPLHALQLRDAKRSADHLLDLNLRRLASQD